jgi:DNA-binding phage protein
LKKRILKEDIGHLHHLASLAADPDVHATVAATIGGYASLAGYDRAMKHREKRAAHKAGKKMIAGMTGSKPKSVHHNLIDRVKKLHKGLKDRVEKSFTKEDFDPTEIYMTEERFLEFVDYMMETYEEDDVIELLQEWAGAKTMKKAKVVGKKAVRKVKKYMNDTDG